MPARVATLPEDLVRSGLPSLQQLAMRCNLIASCCRSRLSENLCSAPVLAFILGRERKYLTAAGGAVEHPIGQAPHLGVFALLAGVAAQGVRQGDYLAECSQHRSAQGAAAAITARRVAID
jgi:hypothetical protein